MSNALKVREAPRRKLTRHEEMGAKAAGLELLTGCKVSVSYSPNTFFEHDPRSKGNLFTGHVHIEHEEDFIHLDARKGHLKRQLAKELKRISRFYKKLAEDVKGGRYED